jgi:Baseplate J-like protein
MEVRVLYLDIDDEITTAASRVRSAEGTRVAIVLPYGSRVATSRINFRLLARDATLNGKRLSIIAGDAATRALAASAGLPMFASVADYESSLETERGEKAAEAGGPTETVGTAGATDVPQAEKTPSVRSPRARRKPRAPVETGDETTGGAVGTPSPRGDSVTSSAAASAAAGSAVAAAERGALDLEEADVAPPPFVAAPPGRAAVPRSPGAVPRGPAAVSAARVMADTPADVVPAAPSRVTGSRVLPAPMGRQWLPATLRAPLVIGLAVLALAVVVGGVGAYVFLPTATAVITPREAAIGPVPLQIVASPAATEPDPVSRTVPAETKSLDVEVNQAFTVVGRRVEEATAKGVVRFRNKDFTSSNTIPRGSIVSTQSGIRFRTDRAVTVRRAELVGLQVFPASASVRVTAVKPGPEGNVEPNTILVIPRGEDPLTLDVTNPDETKGGKRDQFPKVAQADLDAATKALGEGLAAAFAEKLADPELVADGSTVFRDTASLGAATYTVDPATLLGDEIETFDLGASASGTVLTVDESSVQVVAEANIASQVQPGYALVDGSSTIDTSPGEVQDGVITFPATITARQVLLLDPTAIEAEIRGKSLAEAQSILGGYGRAELSVWPDWVGTIPTLDARVEIRTTEAAP